MKGREMMCRLIKLNCFVCSEAGEDEVYIKHFNKQIWPAQKKYLSISNSQELSIGTQVEKVPADGRVLLELWEHNLIMKDVLLGHFSLVVDKVGGPYCSDLRFSPGSKFVKYTLNWEICVCRRS